MAKPKKPENVFLNRDNNAVMIYWDKAVKDISNVYTNIISYYVYKTANSALLDWILVKKIESQDVLGEIDTFCVDFESGEYIYAIVAENSAGLSEYATTYGISGTNITPTLVNNYFIWNQSNWNAKLWH